MTPLARQVMIVTDNAKGGAARLAGLEPPKHEDNEPSFPELMARIDKTVAYLKTFTPDRIDGSEGRTINRNSLGADLELVFWVLTEHDIVTRLASR